MPSKEGLLGSLIGVLVSRSKRIVGLLGDTNMMTIRNRVAGLA